ncbi:MAG TPA: DUF1844 domain-containing protein [Pyrinomonadaceae bacterium]
MSEEKPHFKVTDRRLFNPDGTPRDIERETEATSTTTADTGAPAATGTETAATRPDAASDAAAPPATETARREPTSSPAAETANEARAPAEAATATAAGGTAQAGAEDPTPFANLVMFIASPAAAAMGMTEHPGLAPGELDLPLAKHCIDLLGTIQQKTRGNLGTQEGQIIEGLLAELRMQYISLTSAQRPPAPPRGFTGSDITGGR